MHWRPRSDVGAALLLVCLLVICACWSVQGTGLSHTNTNSNSNLNRLLIQMLKRSERLGTEVEEGLGTEVEAPPAAPMSSSSLMASLSASSPTPPPPSSSLSSFSSSSSSSRSTSAPSSVLLTGSAAQGLGESSFPASSLTSENSAAATTVSAIANSAGSPPSFPSTSTSAPASESESSFTAANLVPRDNSLYPVKIVDRLSPSTKRFVRLDSSSESGSGSESSEDSIDGNDPELQLLKKNLQAIQDSMVNGRRWVDVVRGVVAHYRAKVANVESNLKSSAMEAFRIKGLIVARHKALAKSRLQAQLDKVVAALRQLQDQTTTVSSKKQDLEAMKRELMANIGSIQSQIAGLHESSAPAASAVTSSSTTATVTVQRTY